MKPTHTHDELTDAMKKLTVTIQHATSFRGVFLRGIINGVGTALGATIIAGILLTLLVRFLSTAEFLPYFDTLIQSVEQSPVRRIQ